MSDWNPDLYLKFKEGRNKPIFDLISHIPLTQPGRIIDIGCGPGNSTIALKNKFPDADITGIDNSSNMIEAAKKAHPEIAFKIIDINNDLCSLGKFDIVFSNAVLQWLGNHDILILRLFDLLNTNGVLAVQIPYNFGTPVHGALCELVESEKWSRYFDIKRPQNYRSVGYYYDIISSFCDRFDIWTTKHVHILNTHLDIIEWYKSTGFKVYLEQLKDEALINDFLSDILTAIEKIYKPQENNKILFEFERLFFTVHKPEV